MNNKPKPKFSGNYASEVLAELEARDKNNGHAVAIKALNKEMKGYMRELDGSSKDIASEITKLN